MTERIVCILIGYCFGLFQTGYIIGRLKGIDIRTQGSGNAGTTNAIRTLGKKYGILTFAGDFFKCVLAVLVTWLIFRDSDVWKLLLIYTAAGVVLGHDFPFYLRFRGGKGIAVTAGMIVAFLDWRLMIISFLCFLIPLLLSHTVSLGSLVLYPGFLAGMIVFGQLGSYGLSQPVLTEMYLVTAALAVLAYWRHRGNIARLASGKERKMF